MSDLSQRPSTAPSPQPLYDAPRAPHRFSPDASTPRPCGHAPSDSPSTGCGVPSSAPKTAPSPRATTPLPLSSAIDLLILDLTTEFHDDGHLSSNRTQAARLWRASLLDEDDFIEVMYSARAIVRSRGNIEKRATSGPPHLRNRMPYFFATLRNELRRIGRLSAATDACRHDPTPAPTGERGA